jgi:hypothetical protein
MKRSTKALLLIFAALLSGIVAAIIFLRFRHVGHREMFTSPLSLQDVSIQSQGGITNASDPLHQKNNVIRVVASPQHSVMTAHASGPRSEMITKEGLEQNASYVISFDFLNTSPNNFVTTFFQILDKPKKGLTEPRVKLMLTSTGYTLSCGTSSKDSNIARQISFGNSSSDVNTWTSWRVEFNRSLSGSIQLYKDGQLVASVQGSTMYSPNLLTSPLAHVKWGQYKHIVNSETTVYFANLNISKT